MIKLDLGVQRIGIGLLNAAVKNQSGHGHTDLQKLRPRKTVCFRVRPDLARSLDYSTTVVDDLITRCDV